MVPSASVLLAIQMKLSWPRCLLASVVIISIHWRLCVCLQLQGRAALRVFNRKDRLLAGERHVLVIMRGALKLQLQPSAFLAKPARSKYITDARGLVVGLLALLHNTQMIASVTAMTAVEAYVVPTRLLQVCLLRELSLAECLMSKQPVPLCCHVLFKI